MLDPSGQGAGVFLDTGYLIAVEDADDNNHQVTIAHRDGLPVLPPLTTTTSVAAEVVAFFKVRGQHDKAIELAEMLLSGPSVTMVHISEDLLQRGIALLGERPDKRHSLTDCISFVVMRERGIATAFAFDRHFEQEGFIGGPLRPAVALTPDERDDWILCP